MLTEEQMKDIQDDLTFEYINGIISKKRYPVDAVNGEIPDWYSEDSFKMIPWTYYISGQDVKEFLQDYFYDIVDEYLKLYNVSSASELAQDIDKESEDSYSEFIYYDFLPDVENFYPDSKIYKRFRAYYFDRKAESDYWEE